MDVALLSGGAFEEGFYGSLAADDFASDRLRDDRVQAKFTRVTSFPELSQTDGVL